MSSSVSVYKIKPAKVACVSDRYLPLLESTRIWQVGGCKYQALDTILYYQKLIKSDRKHIYNVTKICSF